jgi:hypothetical protein
LTGAGVVVGTPAYMAPEQARGVDVDHRCDLFSLGCVLYRALTGQMPFPGNDTLAVLMSLVEHTPARISALADGVPAALDELMARLLAKSPGGRPQTAAEVAQSLASIEGELGGAPSLAELTLRLGLEPGATMVTPRAITLPSEPLQPAAAGAARRWRWIMIAAAAAILVPAAWIFANRRTPAIPPAVKLPAPTQPATTIDPAPLINYDEAIAQWILPLGGRIRISKDVEGPVQQIDSLENLPDGTGFFLREINASNRVFRVSGRIAQIKHLNYLKGLQVEATDFSDADLDAIARVLPALESFRVSNTFVTLDSFAKHVVKMTKLDQLGTPNGMEDRYLPLLGALPQLNRLEITSSSVTGAGILTHLPRLKVLMIRKGTLSDADLEQICRLPDLERLELVETGISDAGVAHVRNAKILKLKLHNGLTDAALLHLRDHPTLQEIDIADKNALTAEGVAALRDNLPDCIVNWKDSRKPSETPAKDEAKQGEE